jgi:ATP-dependent exoDNAse (exonuclease V) alpha subunit
MERGSYATVVSANSKDNQITVRRDDGQSVTYRPSRLKGVNVYREMAREIAVGDRLQFTARDKKLEVANRDLGAVIKVAPHSITVQMDGKGERTVGFNPSMMRHFDHGYAVTSHSSQRLPPTAASAVFFTRRE